MKNKVYCISNGKLVKIGKSANIEQRFKNLQNAGGFLIKEQFHVESCPTLEIEAHKHFSDKRVYGEWFDITFEEAKKYLKNNVREEKKKEDVDFKRGSLLAEGCAWVGFLVSNYNEQIKFLIQNDWFSSYGEDKTEEEIKEMSEDLGISIEDLTDEIEESKTMPLHIHLSIYIFTSTPVDIIKKIIELKEQILFFIKENENFAKGLLIGN